ncbi:MAG: 30S ribosomal protein S1 [Candidatus Yanofskybacteria bacterium CG10_big_fil_rev_8_21_14_0_10_46_23]|uniref:30S ribosomal protein S1 n=1 Tax=Candidatus Yanofskybacteria bacterium CG10_big_fil_rev_8_21_14_0_10_46_23 TaxID=1975098 RepID=A0A2H0R3K9_9BACT|nr:MAG: 30S ribosomal protein S1 [Candidatus Yanofskybacteria bacterium CG10_big_fil_rev_8_21_14_0_10_46_23]
MGETITMENLETKSVSLESMKDILGATNFELPQEGEIISGQVMRRSKNNILVDLGALGTGVVYPREFYESQSILSSLKVGDKVSGILLDIENDEGYRELSLRKAHMTTAWEDIRQKKESGEAISTRIININKGGLIVEINGIQGFLPLSQLSAEHYPKVEGGETSKIVQVLQGYRNQDFLVKILDFSKEDQKLIVSEKLVLDEKVKEKIAAYSIGDIIKGTVTDVTDFGAFVKIEDGVEGLIHISEIDWKIIDNPRDILEAGQAIEAKIVNIDGSKISLSTKALQPDPWENIEKKHSVGQEVQGTVVKVTSYGVLVKLEDNIIGIILNTEFGDKKAEEVIKLGETYPMAIVNIDLPEHKMLLTLA